MCRGIALLGHLPKCFSNAILCSQVFGLDDIREIAWTILLVLYQFQVVERQPTVFCSLRAPLSPWSLALLKHSEYITDAQQQIFMNSRANI